MRLWNWRLRHEQDARAASGAVAVGDSIATGTGYTIYEPVGCDQCNGMGYKGRIGIFEFLAGGPDVEATILKEASEIALREAGANDTGSPGIVLREGTPRRRLQVMRCGARTTPPAHPHPDRHHLSNGNRGPETDRAATG